MPSPFVRAMVEVLRASERYRLSAIVEMANLTPEVQEQLTGYYADRCWPLLQQAQFSNLRTAGPWLFGSRPGSDVSAQYDFQWQLEQGAAGAVCGWIVSALPPARLARHLSHANIVTGADGHSYLLRFHTAAALQVFDTHRELPGVSEWLAPIHHWWSPVAHPSKRLWLQISGGDQPQSSHLPPITLNDACWAELAGDPLSYQLAELLKGEPSCPALPAACYGTRVGLIQHYLDQAREQGLGGVLPGIAFGTIISAGSIWLDFTQPESSSFLTVILAIALALASGSALYFYSKYGIKFSRLEMLTSRHLVIRFNRVTQHVHLHRPNNCGGIVTFPWRTTASTGIDPEDDSLSVGMRLGLVWHPSRTGLPHMEMALLGKQGQGGSELRDEWEFIRRYMEEGPHAVPRPRLSTQLPSPIQAFSAQFEGLGRFFRKSSWLFKVILLMVWPAFVTHLESDSTTEQGKKKSRILATAYAFRGAATIALSLGELGTAIAIAKPLFDRLAHSSANKIVRLLSQSMSELAKNLGTQAARLLLARLVLGAFWIGLALTLIIYIFEDDALEKWCKRSSFRVGKSFKPYEEQEELMALHAAFSEVL